MGFNYIHSMLITSSMYTEIRFLAHWALMSRIRTSFSSPLGLVPRIFSKWPDFVEISGHFLMVARDLRLCLPESLELRWSSFVFVEFHKFEDASNKH